MHVVSISCHDADELSAVVLQSLQQRVDSLCTKGVVIVRLQGVSLIDEEHTTHRRIDELIGLDGCLSRIACHQFGTVGFNKLTTRENAQRAEHIGHDTRHGGLTCTRITRKHIMLALEGIRLASLDLQVEEGCKVLYFFLNTRKSDQPVKLFKTLRDIDCLGSLVGNIGFDNRHQLVVRHRGHIAGLQTLSLLLTHLVEERTHRTTIGKVFVARFVELGNHLLGQCLCFWREDILLALGKDKHDLEELIGRVVFYIQEIVETAAEARIDAEQVLHLRTIACCYDDKLIAVVFHSLHQRLQCLCTLSVAVSRLTYRCQCVGLVDKEDAAHCLVAQLVDNLRRLALIGADHLRTVDLNYMSAVQIADSRQDFAQLSGHSGLTRTRITREHDVH